MPQLYDADFPNNPNRSLTVAARNQARNLRQETVPWGFNMV
jgi:hypothetical protein